MLGDERGQAGYLDLKRRLRSDMTSDDDILKDLDGGLDLPQPLLIKEG